MPTPHPRGAILIHCTAPGCRVRFYASRRDTLYCSQRCRSRARMEDAKFRTPHIPKSGVVGVTYNRIIDRWQVRIPENKKLKYVGSFHTLDQAISFHKELTT